LVYKK